MPRENKQSFLKGALVLVAANFLVKIIGAVFKIPLSNILGKDGMGLFSVAYQIYTFMFVIATAGFPVAVSKMVSESYERGDQKDVHKIFQTSLFLLGGVGIIGSTALFVFAKPLSSNVLGNTDAYLGIMAIAPSVFFISLVSAYRGFFQGKQNMYPTAVSEVIEALAKLLIGFFLAKNIMDMFASNAPDIKFIPPDVVENIISSDFAKLQYASSGAVFGVACGTVLALVSLMIIYTFSKKGNEGYTGERMRSRRSIAKELVLIAIPITIGAAVSSLTSLIDLATIMNRLQVNPAVFDKYAHVFAEGTKFAEEALKEGWTAAELLEKKANSLYGMYNGFAFPMFNLPLTIVVALSMSVVPAIAGAIAGGREKEARKITGSAIRITLLFALPCAVGISVLSKPILGLVYNDTDAWLVLQKLAISIIFVSLVSVTNAALQAYGKVYTPLKTMLAGGVLKVLINYFLIPVWGIDAAPIATNVCYAIIVLLNMFALGKHVQLSFNLKIFTAPVLSALIMGIISLMGYNSLINILPDMLEKWAVVISIGISAVAYLILILMTRAVAREDIEMMPFGAKIADVLCRVKLLK